MYSTSTWFLLSSCPTPLPLTRIRQTSRCLVPFSVMPSFIGLWIRSTYTHVTLVQHFHSLPLTIMNTHSFVPHIFVPLSDRSSASCRPFRIYMFLVAPSIRLFRRGLDFPSVLLAYLLLLYLSDLCSDNCLVLLLMTFFIEFDLSCLLERQTRRVC